MDYFRILNRYLSKVRGIRVSDLRIAELCSAFVSGNRCELARPRPGRVKPRRARRMLSHHHGQLGVSVMALLPEGSGACSLLALPGYTWMALHACAALGARIRRTPSWAVASILSA
jgi:hypothetical protein